MDMSKDLQEFSSLLKLQRKNKPQQIGHREEDEEDMETVKNLVTNENSETGFKPAKDVVNRTIHKNKESKNNSTSPDESDPFSAFR